MASTEGPALFTADSAWISNVARMPRARLLLDYLAAFDATIVCGGVKGIEPPAEQCSTWRRIFCYEYGRNNTPFGITVSNETNRLPRCIGICNLGGKHAMYYSDSYTLARVMCLSAQPANKTVIDGINAVLAKAESLDAAVIFCFCLPFQAGLERCHWDVRTLRKTSKGAVKDGELSFCSMDNHPRTVPCTAQLEHWNDDMLRELVRCLKSRTQPTCLDRSDADGADVKMTQKGMESMIEVLKTDRRKIIEEHKNEIDDLLNKHRIELEKSAKRAEDAEQEANTRIAKVAAASKLREETMNSKARYIETHNATLRQELLNQQRLAMEANASLTGTKLERDQETKEAAARQKTLEAQVASLKSSFARQTAQQEQVHREYKAEHCKTLAALNATISELRSSLASSHAANRVVQDSASEAMTKYTNTEARADELELHANASMRQLRVWKAMFYLVAARHANLRENEKTQRTMCEAQCLVLKQRDSKLGLVANERRVDILVLSDQLRALETAYEMTRNEMQKATRELQQAKKEIECKDHLVRETEKRCKSLEKRMIESDQEVKRLTASDTDTLGVSPKKHAGRKGHAQQVDEARHAYVHGPTTFSQNTAAFMSQNHVHQHAFPNEPYRMDPSLENTISQLHSALNCITAMARYSSSNAHQLDVALGKLDALCAFGIGQRPA